MNKIKQLIINILIYLKLEIYFIKYRNNLFIQKNQTGGSSDGKYAALLFCTHLSYIHNWIVGSTNKNNICEFGPGDSLSVGLLYKIFFNKNYIAFDAHPYFQEDLTLKSLNEAINYLKEIFSKDENHFFQNLEKSPFIDYFNKDEFNFNEFKSLLKFEGLENEYDSGLLKNLKYNAPYNSQDTENFINSSDLIFSQAALEHVRDLKSLYKSQKTLLSQNGYIYNHIDFKSHGTSLLWNGYYSWTDQEYTLIEKSNTFQWINRMPLSYHLKLMEESGLNIVKVVSKKRTDGIKKDQISKDLIPFFINSEDLNIHSAIVIAKG